MSRRHHYRRRSEDPAELDMTTFLNLMVALIPFLLVTAVFSRITIVELNLPSSASTATPGEPIFRLEVIVRDEGFELTNGSALIATIPKTKDEYDLKTLGEFVLALKRDYPEADQASVLLEPEIEYDYLIRVMDVVRSAEVPVAGAQAPTPDSAAPQAGDPKSDDPKPGAPATGAVQMTRVALFTEIAVGDAP